MEQVMQGNEKGALDPQKDGFANRRIDGVHGS